MNKKEKSALLNEWYYKLDRACKDDLIEKQLFNYVIFDNILPYCILCLNFSQKSYEYDPKHKAHNRVNISGECLCHGWDIWAFDSCDCWQDDA